MEGGLRQIKEASCRGNAQRSTSSNITHACIRIQFLSLSPLHAPSVCLSNAPIPSLFFQVLLYIFYFLMLLLCVAFPYVRRKTTNTWIVFLFFFFFHFRSFLLLPYPSPFYLPSSTSLMPLTAPVSLNVSVHTCCFYFIQPYEPADDWSEHISSSGKKYYYNCRTEVSQWEKPKEWLERY